MFKSVNEIRSIRVDYSKSSDDLYEHELQIRHGFTQYICTHLFDTHTFTHNSYNPYILTHISYTHTHSHTTLTTLTHSHTSLTYTHIHTQL